MLSSRRVLLDRHLARLERRLRGLHARSRRLGSVRLVLVLGGLACAFAALRGGESAGWAGALACAVVFAGVARVHRRVDAAQTRFGRWRRIQEVHRARLSLAWEDLPPPSPVPLDPSHPFAADLNVLGERSLHHLLDTAATRGGSERLAAFLLHPLPDAAAIRQRQALVRELVPMKPFRDRLALAGFMQENISKNDDLRWDDAPLRAWLSRARVREALRPWLLGLGALAGLNLVLVAGHVGGWLPALWPFTMLAYAALYLSRYRSWQPLFNESHDLEALVRQFSPPLRLLERYPFRQAPGVAALCRPLREEGPSRVLRRLHRIATAASLTRSELLWLLFNALLPYELLLTVLLHRAKADLRDRLPRWLGVWYEVEALAALAAYADLVPGRAFPEVLDESPGAAPLFDGEALGHPLVPEAAKVRNGLRLERPGEIGLITGSNMSGKSTFLRTVGVNAVLAGAGGAVDAARMQLVPLRVFTCLNVSDSVNDGLSYFYAEVKRLRALLDALRAPGERRPLLFLIDEIFRGTNNRERLAGSRAYVRALADGHGAGLIATHDLDLTQLADALPRLRNLHFREDVSSGRMTFDYTLRPGPCPTTNALVIMAREGLPVEAAP